MYGFPLTLDDCYDDDYELRLILALKQQVNETMNYHELKRAIDNDDGNVTTKEADGAVCTNSRGSAISKVYCKVHPSPM